MDYQSPFGLLGDRITSGFGRRQAPRTPFGFGSSFHRGLDLSLSPGESGYPAEAVGAGVVTFAGRMPGYGNMVEVTHPDGYVSRYGHLQELGNIAIGDEIASGTPVGLVGNTGNSGAPHLHLEMRDPQGTPVDPRSVIDFDASVRAPTPSPADRWESAAPMEVAREELSPIAAPEAAPMSAGLLNPSVSEDRFASGPVAQGMGGLQSGLLASNMAMGAPDEGRFASGPVAQGLDALRGGLIAQAGMPDDARFAAGPVAQGVDGLRAGLMSYSPTAAPEVGPSPAAAAIESVAPSTPGLADAYGQLGQTLDEADVIGLSGTKTYNDLAPMGELNAPTTPAVSNPGLFAQSVTGLAPKTVQTTSYTPEQAPQAEIAGPASPTIQTAPSGPTPPADVGSFPAAPTTPGQTAKKVAGRVAGALIGSAALGPVGGLMGGLLGNELASGKGLFSRQPQSVGGLLSSMGAAINDIGRGAQQSYSVWGGGTPVGTQATATDGSKITSLGGGLIARTDPNGVTTTFNDRGNIVGSPVSTGGLFSGIGRDIAEAFGGGGSSSGGTGGDTSGMSPGLW